MSEGGHFKFKSESAWESYSPSQYSNIFSLDLHNLSEAISCIPFYEQLSLSKDLFGEEELKCMNEEAKENTERYNLSMIKKTAVNLAAASKEPLSLTITGKHSPAVTSKSSAKTCDIQEEANFSEALGLPMTENQIFYKHKDLNPLTEPHYILKQSSEKCISPIAEDDDDLDNLLALKEPLLTTQAEDLLLPASQHIASLTLGKYSS